MTDKQVPQSLDAELAVLGSLLIDSDATYKVASTLHPGNFFSEKNKQCYAAILTLYSRKIPVNQVTLTEELKRQGKLELIGGAPYLSDLIINTPTSIHLEYYANIVRQTSIYRQLISAAGQIAGLAYDQAEDSTTKALDILMPLAQANQKGKGFRSFREIGNEYWDEFEKWYKSDSKLFGISSGYNTLDGFLGGLEPKTLYVIMARPSHGKSAMLDNIAVRMARQDYSVAIFSLEMSDKAWFKRAACAESDINRYRFLNKNLTADEWGKYVKAFGELSELPIYIDEMTELTVNDIRARLYGAIHKHKVDVVMIDYLGLIQSKGDKAYEKVTEISKGLTQLKKEFNIPIICAAQLNRANTARIDKRPQVSDARDSGAIEQDADVILGLHREELYTTEDEWKKTHMDEPYPKNVLEVDVLKNREGELARMYFNFKASTGLISERIE